MKFVLPSYNEPDFNTSFFQHCPAVNVADVVRCGVAPANFHATTIFPEYFKLGGEWILLGESRMDAVVVLRRNGSLAAKEFRRLLPGDKIVTGRKEDGSEGIYVHPRGFRLEKNAVDDFCFRSGRSRETSYSRDYDRLYELLRYEKEHGYIVWVLGPAVIFDADSKHALISLIKSGFVDAVLAGNALATHDVEGAVFSTALGQDIYTQHCVPGGHYNHLDIINQVRSEGSLAGYLGTGNFRESVVGACLAAKVPLVLAGSIRDDGPLPEVVADVYAAQDAMRDQTQKATTVVCLATQLHSIATGNMTPSYQITDGVIRPVFIYNVDVSEFAVNKLRDRGTLEVTSIVTNVQDFLVNLQRGLV